MKSRILQMLKDSPEFLSGEEISRRLGVTRAAVWKAITALRNAGYPIEAISNRGYRLPAGTDILTEEEIAVSLRQAGLDQFFASVQFAPVVDSTNLMARRSAEQNAPDRSLFAAERQTAGRGRRGRSWLSDHQAGLWFSLLLRPEQQPASHFSRITLFTALCVAESLISLGADVGIKWPNDLVSAKSGRKIGGILTEMSTEDNRVQTLIIGIGININTQKFEAELASLATSVFLETGRMRMRSEVLQAVLRVFAERYASYGEDNWIRDYRSLCLTLGRVISVVPAQGEAWQGKAIDIDAAGELVAEDETGARRLVLSGEVSVRGLRGYFH